MVWTDDPARDAEQYWAEQDLERPVCTECEEVVWEDHCYRIGGAVVCPRCLENYYREEL